MKRRGLSPVIATVLLISLALVLILIVLLWAKNFIGETAQKFGQPVEDSCNNVKFIAEAESSGKVSVNNVGNVPLYGLEIKKSGAGKVENFGYDAFDGNNLPVGSGKSINFGSLGSGDILVYPIILGETDKYKKPYTCDENFEIVTII